MDSVCCYTVNKCTFHTHAAAVVLILPLSELTDWLRSYSCMQPDITVEINTGDMLRIIHRYINISGREMQLLPGAITDSNAVQVRRS